MYMAVYRTCMEVIVNFKGGLDDMNDDLLMFTLCDAHNFHSQIEL